MTIHEIKRKVAHTNPNFFSRSNMRFFGQSLKDYKVSADGARFKLVAPVRKDGEIIDHFTSWFNPATNDIEHS